MSPQSAQALSDYLVDRPGKLVPRGPLVGAGLGAGVDTVGAIWNPTAIMLSKKTSTAGRVMFPWETHLGLVGRTATNETDLVRADVNLRAVDLGSFVASDQAMTDIGLVPGPRSTQLAGLTYAISLDSAGELAGGDTVTLNDGTHLIRKTELLSFDLSGAALPTFPNPLNPAVNTTSWNTGANTSIAIASVDMNRGTVLPARLGSVMQITATNGANQDVAVNTVLSGTFKRGVTYTITFLATASSPVTIAYSLTGEAQQQVNTATAFQRINYVFTPSADAINPTLVVHGIIPPAASMWVYGFTVTQTTINKFGANAPMAAQDVTAYLSRLFVLGGAAPGSAPASLAVKHSTLWWSDTGGPLTRVLAEWEDDVSGLVNQIQVGDEDPTDPGVGLGRLPTALVIFKRRSMWALRGTAPSNFTDRRVALVGCLDARSIVECHDTVYWLSEQGFMSYDGSTLTNLSRQIQPTLLAAADQSVGVGGVPGGTAVATVLPNDYIYLAIGRRDTDTQLFSGLYHIPTGAWVNLSSAAQVGTARTAFNANGAAYFADGSTLWLANGATLPERNPVADKGATLPDVCTDTVVTISSGVMVQNLSASAKITPFWRTYMIPLSGPLVSSTLQRYLQDYIWIDPAHTTDDVSVGWHVSLKNSLGVELASFDLGTQGTASTKRRRRAARDSFPEASSDVFLEVSVPSTAPKWTLAELYTGILEFQMAKPRLPE